MMRAVSRTRRCEPGFRHGLPMRYGPLSRSERATFFIGLGMPPKLAMPKWRVALLRRRNDSANSRVAWSYDVTEETCGWKFCDWSLSETRSWRTNFCKKSKTTQPNKRRMRPPKTRWHEHRIS